MPDLEKVIKGLTVCTDNTPAEECWKCPYRGKEYCTDAVMQDALALLRGALALLRGQEPVKPIEEHVIERNYCLYYCGGCHAYVLFKKQKYCHACGREIKWND